MFSVKRIIRNLAIKRLVKLSPTRDANDRILDERFVVGLLTDGQNLHTSYSVRGKTRLGLNCKYPISDSEDKDIFLENETADKLLLVSTRTYVGGAVRYSGPLHFLLSDTLQLFYFRELKLRLTKKVFRARFKIREDRLELLTWLVEREKQKTYGADNGNQHIDIPWIIMTGYYGGNVWSLPNSSYVHKTLQMTLDSLVASEDLKKSDSGGYHVTGQAMVTLQSAAENDQRHRDNVRLNTRLLWLTFILAIAAVAQVTVAYLSAFPSARP